MVDVKISVIVPVYNQEDRLRVCLDSVINQTLSDIEIIIVDDASTDKTPVIINEYKEKDSRIKVITLDKNCKQGGARNKGIELATGKYIGFVDSDDWIDLDYFEKLYDAVEKYHSDIAVCSILKHKRYISKYNVKYNRCVFKKSTEDKIKLCEDCRKGFFYVFNKIYRTSFMKQNAVTFDENCVFEDVLFSIKVLFYSSSIVSVPKIKYHYYENPTSTINSSNTDKKTFDKKVAYQKLQGFCKDNNITLSEGLNYYTSKWYTPFVKTYIGQYWKKDLLFGLFPINKEKIDYSFPVDIVYLWVDGNDSEWLKKKQYWQGNLGGKIDFQAIDKGRFVDNQELKYSLRSIEKYLPWINKIYIVTDNQIPNWLDVNNSKIEIIFHSDIIPIDTLPLFNSEAIEMHIPFIPNLSKCFIYGNDDSYVNRYLSKDFFFTPEEFPIVRLKHNVSKRNIATSLYTRSVLLQQKIISERFGKKYLMAPHHNFDAYQKFDFVKCIDLFKQEFNILSSHKFRTENDIQRALVLYYSLAIKHASLKYYSRIDRYLSLPVRFICKLKKIYSADSIVISMKDKNPYRLLQKYNPCLFCTNDGEGVSDYDRARIKIFLEERFQEPSSFEK